MRWDGQVATMENTRKNKARCQSLSERKSRSASPIYIPQSHVPRVLRLYAPTSGCVSFASMFKFASTRFCILNPARILLTVNLYRKINQNLLVYTTRMSCSSIQTCFLVLTTTTVQVVTSNSLPVTRPHSCHRCDGQATKILLQNHPFKNTLQAPSFNVVRIEDSISFFLTKL